MSKINAPGIRRARVSSCLTSGDSMTIWLVIYRVGSFGAILWIQWVALLQDVEAGELVPTSLWRLV